MLTRHCRFAAFCLNVSIALIVLSGATLSQQKARTLQIVSNPQRRSPQRVSRSELAPTPIYDFHKTPVNVKRYRKKISLRISQRTIRDTLLKLVQAANVDYAIAVLPEDNKRITLNLKDVSLETALQSVLDKVNKTGNAMTCFWSGNLLGIGPSENKILVQPADARIRLSVAFRAQNGDMADAISALLRAVRVSFMLHPAMRGHKITVAKQDGPLLDVLNIALKAAPVRFAAAYEDHVMMIRPETASHDTHKNNKKERKGGSN